MSVLEGGYDVLGGCASPLAQSVLAHVEALCSHHYEECDPEIWKMESEIEKKGYEEDAAAKGETVMSVMEPEQEMDEKMSEEGSFDFDAMSEEEEVTPNPLVPTEKPTSPVESTPATETPQLKEGGKKRQHKKVDYVALEAQLKREEEEMRKKQKKECIVC